MKKKLLSLLMVSVLAISMTVPAFADEESDLVAARNEAYSALETTNQTLAVLTAQQQQIEAEISTLNQNIVDLMIQIEQAETDIANTEADIVTTQAEIEQKQVELQAAQDECDTQYESMKKRIQYIYESGGNNAWLLVVLESEDFASFMNSAEYASELESADRAAFEKLQEAVETVKTLKAQLESEKQALETQKASLEAQKTALDEQNVSLQTELAAKQATDADYAAQIEVAKQQAAQLNSLIAAKTAAINEIQEQKAREAEAAAQGTATASQVEAIAEEQAEAARQAVISNGGSRSEANQAASYVKNAVKEYASSGSSSSKSSSSSSTKSASDIISYANSFVGGKYSWGGSSKETGYDCSHFVTEVVSKYGYSGGYRTSGEWASAGSSVSSLSEAKAGDVIVYSGHVAIYDGNGGIIEAQSTKAGITNTRKADSSKIVAIRRVTG